MCTLTQPWHFITICVLVSILRFGFSKLNFITMAYCWVHGYMGGWMNIVFEGWSAYLGQVGYFFSGSCGWLVKNKIWSTGLNQQVSGLSGSIATLAVLVSCSNQHQRTRPDKILNFQEFYVTMMSSQLKAITHSKRSILFLFSFLLLCFDLVS